ncbi:MAG: threonine/serine dehydratase [Rhodospirillales bacterium]|jgi:threonine dehydratase|nr:pyridoxal-5'-phosphate-dependent protein [Rhodospirillaceae bacterium]MDP6430089.1 threonine/serine dehydratase [Rhodospirillales bacterium]MDP6643097.1 threonine/serine dehydratase [Rhodospirillales bacterium]MDP6841990.1 threonine/serine dehydratase [Rhodospirillales bacterium]
MHSPPVFADIEAAAERLRNVALVTPVLESEAINDALGCRVLVKAECLQRTGAFKIRGAYNKIAGLGKAARGRGVVAFSSGNHAQGVARAARILDVDASIVMPADAPAIKIANTKSDGARIVPYQRRDANRVEIAGEIAMRTGATLIPPYDDPEIIAGQGTIGLELARQAGELGVRLDALLGPCSGGGMIGGTAIALSHLTPETEIYAVEPEGYDDWAISLAAGMRTPIKPEEASICDALLLEMPGELTFAVNRKLLSGALTASDDAVRAAMRLAFDALKIVLEPSGAVGIAALLQQKSRFAGKTVAVIATGGNVDRRLFAEIIGAEAG